MRGNDCNAVEDHGPGAGYIAAQCQHPDEHLPREDGVALSPGLARRQVPLEVPLDAVAEGALDAGLLEVCADERPQGHTEAACPDAIRLAGRIAQASHWATVGATSEAWTRRSSQSGSAWRKASP